VVNTLWTGAVVTAVAVAGGTAAAMATERSAAPGRRWLRLGLLLPLIIPSFVAALSWAQAYGPAGLLDDVLGVAVPGVFGPLGVVAVLVVEAMPLAYLAVASGLASRAEPDLERAARASGANARQVFVTVTLPLLRPAMAGAAALVFVTTVNAFGVPAILGLPARFSTVTTRIYSDLAFAASPAAFSRAVTLSAALVILTLAVVGPADARGLGRGAERTAVPAGGGLTGTSARWPGVASWVYVVAATVLPLLALVLIALTRAVGVPSTPANWTLAHFAEALDGRTVAAFGRSLLLAGVAATAVVLLGGLLTVLRHRRAGRGLGSLAILSFAVPGTTLAVAMLLAYGPWLRDTLALILVAYVAKFWAVGHRTVAGAADSLPMDLSRAARVSGADALTAARTIVVPLLRPALGAAWLAVFLFGLHELTMSSLLYGPGSKTLAVVILNLAQLGDPTVTSALAVLLTALLLALATPLLLVFTRKR
jgi:iron(III) transport system permease protein